jgi:hypothetical protein
MKMQPLLAGGLEGHGACLIELAPAAATHDQMAIAVLNQPGDVGVGRHAGVHDHQRSRRHPQPGQHGRQRAGLGDFAGEGL